MTRQSDVRDPCVRVCVCVWVGVWVGGWVCVRVCVCVQVEYLYIHAFLLLFFLK